MTMSFGSVPVDQAIAYLTAVSECTHFLSAGTTSPSGKPLRVAISARVSLTNEALSEGAIRSDENSSWIQEKSVMAVCSREGRYVRIASIRARCANACFDYPPYVANCKRKNIKLLLSQTVGIWQGVGPRRQSFVEAYSGIVVDHRYAWRCGLPARKCEEVLTRSALNFSANSEGFEGARR